MDHHSNQHALAGSHGPEDLAAEVLIGRIVDGEALPVDRVRFEDLATANPMLWKLLALRQQDAAALTLKFEDQTAGIEHIELPALSSATGRISRAPWWLTITGWAAVLVVAVLWGMQHAGDVHERNALKAAIENDPFKAFTPDDHLRLYKSAPFVMGEWPPTLLASEKLPDGRTFIRMLRRIEETAYIDADKTAPVGPDGRLTMPPDEIRSRQGQSPGEDSVAKPN